MRVTVKEGFAGLRLTVNSSYPQQDVRIEMGDDRVNITTDLTPEERDALVRALMCVESRPQYAIMHPSERLLQKNYSDEEVWGHSDGMRLILFSTIEEAQARIDERSERWPESDWPYTHVVEFLPGVQLYPKCREVKKST